METHRIAFAGLQLRCAGRSEERLDPDARATRSNRQGQIAFDGAATGFAQTDDHFCFERARGAIDLRQRDRQHGAAAGIGIGQGLQRLARRYELFVRQAEAITSKARYVFCGRLYDDLAFNAEIGGRRAVKIFAVEPDRTALAGFERGRDSSQRHVEPFGYEVLDQERRRRNGLGFRIGVDAKPPSPGLGAATQGHVSTAAADVVVDECDAFVFDAVGPGNDQGHRQLRGLAKGVADQCC